MISGFLYILATYIFRYNISKLYIKTTLLIFPRKTTKKSLFRNYHAIYTVPYKYINI